MLCNLKEELTKCTLVYTSRPEARPYINGFLNCNIDVIVIHGFTKESVGKYISSTFEKVTNGRELSDTLKSQLHNNPMVECILHVPINLVIVCLIFFHFSTLPETLTGLYTLLCLRLILRHIITRTSNEEQIEKLASLNSLPGSVSEQFSQLCYLAYRGMETRTIVFTAEYLYGIGVDENKLSCLGLLKITPTTSVYGREKSYNFLHLTLQEFCAAWHISKLSTEEQLGLLKIDDYDGHFEMVWKFYSGITGLKNKQILNFMLPYNLLRSSLAGYKMRKLLYYAYEAHNDEVCRVIGDHCDGSIYDLYPEHLKFSTYSFDNHKTLLQALTYFIIHYKGVLKLIDIRTWHITDREVKIVVDSLQKRLSLQNADVNDKLTFKVFMQHTTSESYTLFANLLALQYPISELYITNPDCDSSSVTCCKSLIMACKELLTQGNTLSVLDISGIDIEPEGAAYLTDCKNVQLQDFRMKWCKLGIMGADKIGEMLAYNSSIISIDLSYNNICDEGVEKMVHHLTRSNNTLQHINLCGNCITGVGVDHLSKLLHTNSTVTSLDLSYNKIQYEDVYRFLNSLNNPMEYLGLYGYCFIDKVIASAHAVHKVKSFGFIHRHLGEPLVCTPVVEVVVYPHNYNLIKAIFEMQCIKELKIYYIVFTCSKMVQDLSVYLSHTQSLEKLEIRVGKRQPYGDDTLKVIKSFTNNTSLKKIKCSGIHIDMASLEFQSLLTQLSDTLEELTLHAYGEYKHLQNVSDTLQGINQVRCARGVSIPLKLKLLCERHEGFDIDI